MVEITTATDTAILLKDILSYFNWTNVIFLTTGMIGMFAHAVKKYLAGQLNGSIMDYLFGNNPKRTILAVLSTFGMLIGMILGEQLPNQAGAFLMLSFLTGFGIDSTVNKDE